MSTKCTIGYDEDWHLYSECFENDNVHLILEDIEFSVDKSSGKSVVKVQIPIEKWRSIVKQWDESYWAEHPEMDHKHIDFDFPVEVAEPVVKVDEKKRKIKIAKPVVRPQISLEEEYFTDVYPFDNVTFNDAVKKQLENDTKSGKYKASMKDFAKSLQSSDANDLAQISKDAVLPKS